MPGYVVTAVFELDGGSVRAGQDLLPAAWGSGHRFSYCDGRLLTLVVEVQEPSRAEAFEAVLEAVDRHWAQLGGDPLPTPASVRIEPVVPQVKRLRGPVGDGPDCLIAESAACVAARLRATRAALSDLESQVASWAGRSADPVPGPELRALPEIEALLPRVR